MSHITLSISHHDNLFAPFESAFHECVVERIERALKRTDAAPIWIVPRLDMAAKRLTLTVHAAAADGAVPLWHFDDCEARSGVYVDEGRSAKVKAIKLAACALLEQPQTDAAPASVLITQRNARMRLNANAFVVPGGHLDATDAGIVECALRELQEETGLRLDAKHARITAAYEAVYARSHYLIFYVHGIAPAPIELASLLVPPSEVQLLLWLPKTRVHDILGDEDGDATDLGGGLRVPESSRQRKRLLSTCERCESAAVCGEHLEPTTVAVSALVGDADNEGIAFGTRKLLLHWAEH